MRFSQRPRLSRTVLAHVPRQPQARQIYNVVPIKTTITISSIVLGLLLAIGLLDSGIDRDWKMQREHSTHKEANAQPTSAPNEAPPPR